MGYHICFMFSQLIEAEVVCDCSPQRLSVDCNVDVLKAVD